MDGDEWKPGNGSIFSNVGTVGSANELHGFDKSAVVVNTLDGTDERLAIVQKSSNPEELEGFCYLRMVKFVERKKIALQLGAYPIWKDVFRSVGELLDADAITKLAVRVVADGRYHIELFNGGVRQTPLQFVVVGVRRGWHGFEEGSFFMTSRVGGELSLANKKDSWGQFVGLVARARMSRILGASVSECLHSLELSLYHVGLSKTVIGKYESELNAGNGGLASLPGYCYLSMVSSYRRLEAMVEFGPNPSLSVLLSADADWWDRNLMRDLVLSVGSFNVAHLSKNSDGVPFLSALSYVLSGDLSFPSWKWVENLRPIETELTLFHSIGLEAKYDTLIAQAYASMLRSPAETMYRGINDKLPVIMASLYFDDPTCGYRGNELRAGKTRYGGDVLHVPAVSYDAAYLLPPGIYYAGLGFNIGSAVKPTIILAPSGYGISISSQIRATSWDVDEKYFRLYHARADGLDWWKQLWARGLGARGESVRTQANALFHIDPWKQQYSVVPDWCNAVTEPVTRGLQPPPVSPKPDPKLDALKVALSLLVDVEPIATDRIGGQLVSESNSPVSELSRSESPVSATTRYSYRDEFHSEEYIDKGLLTATSSESDARSRMRDKGFDFSFTKEKPRFNQYLADRHAERERYYRLVDKGLSYDYPNGYPSRFHEFNG